ncbi:MAG: ElyC/SanA/YdcF family protein [Arcobacteraceae bacterium]|jgi:uncharacterized SAM-binding protein YcdF (DUF218 family)|nr:ElyC/SanA/YdcF family protein [Arcobacteraceae bacterium]
MSFTLKKIISFFIMPISIGLMLCLLALYFLIANKMKKAKLFLSLTLVWFFLISFAPFSNALVKPLEDVYPKISDDIQGIEYVLLLGGDFQNRAYEVLRLYQQINNLKIITSGYEGAKQISEAQETKEKLIQLGVHEEDIIVQATPKDTVEEAIEVKNIIQSKPVLLVTSALHMPRAMLIFKNEGVNVIAAPTHFLYQEEVSFYHLISAKYLLNTQQAIHEYVGILYTLLNDIYKTFKGMI